MTKEELIQNGWEPRLCRIDTLYFKDSYFIRLIEETAKVYSVHDDMNPLGEAKTLEDIFNIKKEYERKYIKQQELIVEMLKKTFEIKYKEKV